MHRAHFIAIALATSLGVATVSGCTSSGTAYNPPGRSTLAYHHLYVTNQTNAVDVYDLPITSSSTPAAIVSVSSDPAMVFVDAKGRLFVGHFGSTTVEVFKTPLTSSSTPAFTLTSSNDSPDDIAEDASGNVYTCDTDTGGYIDIFDGPVDGNASPSATISNNGVGTSGLEHPYGCAVAANGDFYASDTSDINQYTPPFTSSSVPSASVAPNDDNYGLRVDSQNRVFVADATGNGVVDVYTQPVTNSSTPAFALTFHSGTAVFGIAFDGSGNLWAIDSDNNLWEVTAPITASSTPTQVLTGLVGYGIAFGP